MGEYLPLSHSEDKSTSCGSEALPDDELRGVQIPNGLIALPVRW